MPVVRSCIVLLLLVLAHTAPGWAQTTATRMPAADAAVSTADDLGDLTGDMAPMLMPLTTWTRHERTSICMPGVTSSVATADLVSDDDPVRVAAVTVSSEPEAQPCFSEVATFVATVSFHAGGDRRTYRGGSTPWTSTVRGSIQGYRNGAWETIRSGITITIDETHPEAVVVETLLVIRHPYENPTTGYQQLAFLIDADDDNGTPGIPGDDILGFVPPVSADIQALLRLEMAFADHIVHDFTALTTPPVTLNAPTPVSWSAPPGGCGSPSGNTPIVSGSAVTLSWEIDPLCVGDVYTNYQVEVLRLYHRGATPQTDERVCETTVDWSRAMRLETGSAERTLTLTLTEGDGYYIFRVRPVSAMFPGGASNRLNLAPWTAAPSTGDAIAIDRCYAPYTLSDHPALFFYQQFDDHRIWSYGASFTQGGGQPLRLGEGMTYADAMLRGRQVQGRSVASATIIGAQQLYDYDGRPSMATMAAPLGSMTAFGYAAAPRNAGGFLYGPMDFDNVGTVFAPATMPAGTTENLVSQYHSSSNSDPSIPSAADVPFARTLFYPDGRPYTASAPGALHTPTLTNLPHLGAVAYASVTEAELVSIFGSEAPLASTVTKTMVTTPDGVGAVQYRDTYGRVIATCLQGGAELFEAVDGDDLIVGDGTQALRNLSGAGDRREKINVLGQEYRITALAPSGDDTYRGATTFTLDKERAVFFDHRDTRRFYQFQHNGSSVSCIDHCFECDYTVELKITRMSVPAAEVIIPEGAPDLAPLFEQLGASAEACPEPAGANARDTFTVVLPPGTYRVERILRLRADLLRNPPVDMEAVHVAAMATMRPIGDIYTEIFGSSADADEAWSHYLTYRSEHEASVSMRADMESCPWISLPLVDCEENECDGPPELEDYLVQAYLKATGSTETVTAFKWANDVTKLVRRQNPATGAFDGFFPKYSTSGSFIDPANPALLQNRGWGFVNEMVTYLQDPAGANKTCEEILAAWKQAVAFGMMNIQADGDRLVNFDIMAEFARILAIVPDNRYDYNNVTDDFYGTYLPEWARYVYCPDYDCYANCYTGYSTATIPDLLTCLRNSVGERYRDDVAKARAEELLGEATDNGLLPCKLPTVGGAGLAAYEACVQNYLRTRCMDNCEARKTEFVRIVREAMLRWSPSSDPDTATIMCRADALFNDCQDGCNIVIGSGHSDALTEAYVARMYGLPVLSPTPCTAPARSIDIAPQLLDLLIAHLNQVYHELAFGPDGTFVLDTTDRTKVFCHNFANEAYDFLRHYMADIDVPLCVVAHYGAPADCEDSNPWNLQIVPGVGGSFSRPQDSSVACCNLYFRGPRLNEGEEHPWVTALNTAIDAIWAAPVDYGGAALGDTVSSAWSGHDGYVTTAFTQGLVSPMNDSLARDFRNSLIGASEGVNGMAYPFHAVAAYVTDTTDLAPMGVIVLLDQEPFRLHVTGRPDSLQWYTFGSLHVAFRDMKLSPREPPSFDEYFGFFVRRIPGDVPGQLKGVVVDIRVGRRGLEEHHIERRFEVGPEVDLASVMEPLVDSAFSAMWARFEQADDGSLRMQLPPDITGGRPDYYDFQDLRFYRMETRKLFRHDDACMTGAPVCITLPTCAVCAEWKLPEAPESPTVQRYTCADYKVMEAKRRIAAEYASRRVAIEQTARRIYARECLDAARYDNRVTMSFQDTLYHYTLAYYDRAGNLVRTVPPQGVDIDPMRTRADLPAHTMVTSYTYDAMGMPKTVSTPDAGTSTVVYDARRRPRFTQTSQQQLDGRWSYVKYDMLGRPTESGEFALVGIPSHTDAADAAYPAAASADLVRTVYSTPALAGTFDDYGVGTAQKNLRGRVSYAVSDKDGNLATTDDQVTTYYSYDAVGTVTWQVQSIPGLGLARTEYDIDAGSGRVKRISFERGRSAQFFTEYDYDADGRLTAVRTSPNGVLWDQDAHYTYAKDGSLRRTVLGEDSLQGIDYTHTLHGQLKGINVPTLDEDDDPGHDGKTSTPTSEIPQDVFGMALEYYAGDFDRPGSVFHTAASPPSTRLAPETPLYGGNVTAWSMKTIATGDASLQHDGELTGETYRYDRLGRLRDATYRIYEGGSHWNGAADSGYSSAYRYDGNGSVLGIDRRGLDNTGTPVQFDEQTHLLTANTNQLEQVVDSDPIVVAGYDDVRGQTSVNYHYDADGRLTSDDQATQTMTYTSDDKVSTVSIGGTTTIERLYGPDGRNAVSTSTTGGSEKRTYQIHGGGLDPVAIVTQDGEDDPVVSEILIQGLGRVGVYTGDNTVAYGTTIPPPASYEIYYRTVGRKLYEITDHIGNVRAVIGDVKEPLGGDEYGVQLKSVQNYYPYGMPRPNNVWSAGSLTQSDPYRFGFQGMQRDADVGNSITAPSTTPFRQYDARLARWWSVDPLSAQTSETYQALGGNPISMVDPWGLEDGTPIAPGSKSGGFWGMIGQGLGKAWNVVGSFVAGLAGDVMGGGSAAKAGDAQKPSSTTQTSKQPETKKAAEKKSKGQDRGAAEVASAFGRGFVEGIKGRAEGLWNFAVGWAKSGQSPEQYVGTQLVATIVMEYHKTPEQRRRDMPVNIPGIGRIPWVTNGDVENTVRTAGEINQAEGSQAAWEYVAGEVGKKTGEATFDIAVTVATEGAGRVVGAAGRAGSAAGKVAGSVADDVATLVVPKRVARVIPEGLDPTMLGAPGSLDVFVVAADDIAGLNATQLAERLTIEHSPTGFTIIEFDTPSGIASPYNRTNPGFINGGRTAGGAREFVVPNQPIPVTATRRTVR